MKKLELKEMSLQLDAGSKDKATYGDVIRFVLNTVPQGGFTPAAMRSRLRLLDLLDNADGEIEMEDADAKELRTAVAAQKWNVMHKDILQFCDDVEAMK